MKKKISKKFLIFSISLLLSVITGIILACAGGDDFLDFYNSFFAPETSLTPEAKPYYRSIHTFYGFESFDDAINVMDSTNIKEWYAFFERKVSKSDLNYIIYKSRISEIDTCIFYLKNNTYPISRDLKNNTLLTYINKNLVIEFLFYLGYAKRCEPYATYVNEWWDDDASDNPRNDVSSMNKLLAGGKKAITNVKSPFIKERYIFQITRVLHFLELDTECIDYYKNNNGLFTSQNSIFYRTIGYAAASYRKLGNYSQANYLYSLIFDNCHEMRKICFLSFAPQEDSDWEESLALAQNSREKEVLWHLLGIYADPLRAMKEIYQLNPKSDLLDLLVVRAVNVNEEYFLPDQWSENRTGYKLITNNVDEELLSFSQTLADAGNTNKPYLWYLVNGYLKLANGDFKSSEYYLAKANSISPSDQLIEDQIRAFKIMNKIEQYEKPDSKKEEELASDLNWLGEAESHQSLRSSNIYNWALKRLSEKYLSWGDYVKAQCLNSQQNRSFYDDEEKITSLISYFDKQDKNKFDEYLIGIHPYTKPDLYTYRGIKLIYQYNFQEALYMFESCHSSGEATLYADPFIIHMNDCHDCDFEAEKEFEYNQLSFVNKMLELESLIETDPENASEYYFLYANGLYNMTYFGNCRKVYDSPLFNIDYVDFWYNNQTFSNPVLDCSEALKYYDLASENSNDKEFKAKCCFMAAKCEQNQYFISDEFNNDAVIRSGTYYTQLKNQYSETKYFQEIIRECGYFRTYIHSN